MTSRAERRLLDDLRGAGYETRSIAAWLFAKPQVYLGAGEILVDHLRSSDDEKLVQNISRLLSHREFAFAVPALITKLGEVEQGLTKTSIAGALLAIGVGGHERDLERLLAEGCSTTADGMLMKALRNTGADVTAVERQVLARERSWSVRLFGIVVLILGVLMLGVAVMAAVSPRYSQSMAVIASGWGLICAATGVTCWRRTAWAMPMYVVWVVALLAMQTYYLARVRPVGWPLLLLVSGGGVVVFLIVGRYLFGEGRGMAESR